jgi:hypothetical protein
MKREGHWFDGTAAGKDNEGQWANSMLLEGS